MKTLKYMPELVPLILSGKKTTTWRLFDDKDLQSGDEVEFFEKGKDKPFTKARLVKVYVKIFKDLEPEDSIGHEQLKPGQETYEYYTKLYNKPVGPETLVKIIHFELI